MFKSNTEKGENARKFKYMFHEWSSPLRQKTLNLLHLSGDPRDWTQKGKPWQPANCNSGWIFSKHIKWMLCSQVFHFQNSRLQANQGFLLRWAAVFHDHFIFGFWILMSKVFDVKKKQQKKQNKTKQRRPI